MIPRTAIDHRQGQQTVGISGKQRHGLGVGSLPRCRMSLEAIAWAITDAPDVPPECVSLLVGLANHADSRGRGAYAWPETSSRIRAQE